MFKRLLSALVCVVLLAACVPALAYDSTNRPNISLVGLEMGYITKEGKTQTIHCSVTGMVSGEKIKKVTLSADKGLNVKIKNVKANTFDVSITGTRSEGGFSVSLSTSLERTASAESFLSMIRRPTYRTEERVNEESLMPQWWVFMYVDAELNNISFYKLNGDTGKSELVRRFGFSEANYGTDRHYTFNETGVYYFVITDSVGLTSRVKDYLYVLDEDGDGTPDAYKLNESGEVVQLPVKEEAAAEPEA